MTHVLKVYFSTQRFVFSFAGVRAPGLFSLWNFPTAVSIRNNTCIQITTSYAASFQVRNFQKLLSCLRFIKIWNAVAEQMDGNWKNSTIVQLWTLWNGTRARCAHTLQKRFCFYSLIKKASLRSEMQLCTSSWWNSPDITELANDGLIHMHG